MDQNETNYSTSLTLSPRVRLVIYVASSIGTPVMGYLFANGIVGEFWIGLWGVIVTAANALAALNTPRT
ncbi:hypothetical protein MPC38_06835 [Prescottella equi]|uniref:hypothetical protein n=1 Tax=Rhodococcus hoagii TaxID=43767 RepID=UPI001F5B0C2C|nr:hypothetical protein [Prescottella equi]UNQ40961.1 hypothetical protein MPC38_06835 [Prescottella equi]